MTKLNTPRNYALISGVILFLLGFCGFAFRNALNVPDWYLFLSLVMGVWGIVVGARG